MCIRDLEPLRHSKYVDDCCSILLQAAEFTTDVDLVQLTRIHGAARQIALSFDKPSDTNLTCANLVQEPELHPGVSSGPKQDALITLHRYSILIYTYEQALEPRTTSLATGSESFARLHTLHACLETTRLFLETYHAIPAAYLFEMSYMTLNLLARAIVVLSKLSMLVTTGWDRAHVQKVVSFSGNIDRLIQKIDDARADAAEETVQNDHDLLPKNVPRVFIMLPNTLQKVLAVHEAMSATVSRSFSQSSNTSSANTISISADEGFISASAQSYPDFFNEHLWQDLTCR
jgi:hypothetical protein